MEEQLSRRPAERPGPAERIKSVNVLTTRVIGGNSCYGPYVGHRANFVGRKVRQCDERPEVLYKYHTGAFQAGQAYRKPQRRPGTRPRSGRSQRVDLGANTGPNACWKLLGHLFGRGNGCKDITDLGQLDYLSCRPDFRGQRFQGLRHYVRLNLVAYERHDPDGARLCEAEQTGTASTVDIGDLLAQQELDRSGVGGIRGRTEHPVKDDGCSGRHTLRNDGVQRSRTSAAFEPDLRATAVVDLYEGARGRHRPVLCTAAVGCDRDENTTERVVNASGAFGEAGRGADQGADIRPMGHKLVEGRDDANGGFGLGVDT